MCAHTRPQCQYGTLYWSRPEVIPGQGLALRYEFPSGMNFPGDLVMYPSLERVLSRNVKEDRLRDIRANTRILEGLEK